VELDVEVSSAGFVVLVESFGRGWRATVDGLPAEILRANHLFRGLRLPRGRHRVVFSYRPLPVVLGLALSSLALLGGLAFVIRHGRRVPPSIRNRRQAENPVQGG
jgi:uncharacterized membrane protein YfhO